jgi:hypothetical protein
VGGAHVSEKVVKEAFHAAFHVVQWVFLLKAPERHFECSVSGGERGVSVKENFKEGKVSRSFLQFSTSSSQ